MADTPKHTPNGDSTTSSGKAPKSNQTKPASSETVNSTTGKTELSNAEKKKLQKAEKAARRAKDKEAAAAEVATPSENATPVQASMGVGGGDKQAAAQEKKSGTKGPSTTRELKPKQGQQENKGIGKGSMQESSKVDRMLPHRRRMSHGAQAEGVQEKENKQISFFAHLYGQPRKQTLEGSAKEIHPAITTLGLQLSSYTICGSQARCVAMLLALKMVIKSYTTPMGTSLPRHLSSHYLSPQLSHIKNARPFSTTQANAIRWLKNYIANIDPSVPETKAKNEICDAIDNFIRERFTVADQIIADVAAGHVQNGDVVLTFGKSAVVEQSLLTAAKKGQSFRVVVVDSRPLFEGKNLANTLASADIEVTYCLAPGLAYVAKDITLCMLGAHAMLGNGRLYSRAGTALVAMTAKEQNAPVVVCAESIKFTERVALDSIVYNELAPEEELSIPADDLVGHNGVENPSKDLLSGWREKQNLQILNLLFDATPTEFIDMVITEYGSLPPTSALAVQRMSAGA